jgi:hypothetical protein
MVLRSGLCVMIFWIGDHKAEYSHLFLLFTKIPEKTALFRKLVEVLLAAKVK